MEREVVEQREVGGFGFPVVARNASVHEHGEHRALAIGPKAKRRAVLRELVAADHPWTGNHVRYVRGWLKESMADFGDVLGVSAAAVQKWEDKGPEPTRMARGTEYMLRSRVASTLREQGAISDAEFVERVDAAMNFDPDASPSPVEFDAEELEIDHGSDGPDEGEIDAAL